MDCGSLMAPSNVQEKSITETPEMSVSKPHLHDFESQTDPLSSRALAATAAGNDLAVPQPFSISSPFSHIEKELLNSAQVGKSNVHDEKLQDCLTKLLNDMDYTFNNATMINGIFS